MLPLVDDADPVAALHLLDVMGGDDDGQLALHAQRPHMLPQALARLRIEPDGRLIEKQHAGIVHQGAGDLQPAFHAGGERAHQAVAPVGEFDQRQQFVDAAFAPRRRHAIDEAVEIEILVDGQPVVEARLLEHDAETLPRLQRAGDHVDAVDAGAAAVRPEDGAQDVQQRGLAGAVGAKQREQLVRRDRKADRIERERAAVALGHAADLDGRSARQHRWHTVII